jgi:hypothetical protein
MNIKLENIKCQYNPLRFKHWKSLHSGPIERVLDIKYSPHVKFLNEYIQTKKVPQNTSYHRMHMLYGKDNAWINDKVESFVNLYETIKTKGYNGSVILLPKPKHINKYNTGYEIWEGHHRCSICYVLNYDVIECKMF